MIVRLPGVAIRAASWKVNILGLNGPIKFEKDDPKGLDSGRSAPNVYLVKVDSGKVTVPKTETNAPDKAAA